MNGPNWTEVDQMDWSVSNFTEMDQSVSKWKWIEVVQTRPNGPKWTETDQTNQTKLKCYTDLFQLSMTRINGTLQFLDKIKCTSSILEMYFFLSCK